MPGGFLDDLSVGPGERNPVRAAQRDLARSLPRRLYQSAGAAARDGAFVVVLDGRPARTPAGATLALPTLAAAEAVAAEWQAQTATVDPATMPITRIVNAALDGVARAAAAVQADIVNYSGSDLICYRADTPETLVRAEAAAWDPVLDWARSDLRARFVLSQGAIFVEQPATAIAAVRTAVAAFAAPIRLACVHVMTTLTGSALLALAVAHRHVSADAAWAAAHVDEDFQMRAWGADAEALERRAGRWRDMDAAARLLFLAA